MKHTPGSNLAMVIPNDDSFFRYSDDVIVEMIRAAKLKELCSKRDFSGKSQMLMELSSVQLCD